MRAASSSGSWQWQRKPDAGLFFFPPSPPAPIPTPRASQFCLQAVTQLSLGLSSLEKNPGTGLCVTSPAWLWVARNTLSSCCGPGCWQVRPTPVSPPKPLRHLTSGMECLRFIKFSRLHLHKPLYEATQHHRGSLPADRYNLG